MIQRGDAVMADLLFAHVCMRVKRTMIRQINAG